VFALLIPSNYGTSQEKTTLNVFSATSLTSVFPSIAALFEKQNPSIHVSFNFAGSQRLQQQISEGAPADVFASADIIQMAHAQVSGRIDASTVVIFAHNFLVIVTPRENDKKLSSISDLAHPSLKIIVCARSVPAGHYAMEFLNKCSSDLRFGERFTQQVIPNIVSYEENVRTVLTKVVLGECDAGIVYSSDAESVQRGQISRIEIPSRYNIIADYPIAVLKDSPHRKEAKQFVAFVLSEECANIFRTNGFTSASTTDRTR